MTWFVVTIMLPVGLPVLAMVTLRWLPSLAVEANWVAPIKDGQLCWLALGMAFSGIYELLNEPRPKGMVGEYLVLVALILGALIFFSGLIAALGGVGTPTNIAIPAGKRWYQHFLTLFASVGITVVAAATYTLVHFANR